jgi:hypothetical protein
MSTLLSIHEWQTRSDDALAADEHALDRQLLELESDRKRLRDALGKSRK